MTASALPGRRIVADALDSGDAALPWADLAAFARRAIEIALADRAAARRHEGWTFFDRGPIDAVAATSILRELGVAPDGV